jgi:hypothetical protein
MVPNYINRTALIASQFLAILSCSQPPHANLIVEEDRIILDNEEKDYNIMIDEADKWNNKLQKLNPKFETIFRKI